MQNSNCELLKVYVGLRVEYVSVLLCFHHNRNASKNVSTSNFTKFPSHWTAANSNVWRDGHHEANRFRTCFANAPHNTDTKCLDGEKFRSRLSDVFTSVASNSLLPPPVVEFSKSRQLRCVLTEARREGLFAQSWRPDASWTWYENWITFFVSQTNVFISQAIPEALEVRGGMIVAAASSVMGLHQIQNFLRIWHNDWLVFKLLNDGVSSADTGWHWMRWVEW
jgi:hypothetical protein